MKSNSKLLLAMGLGLLIVGVLIFIVNFAGKKEVQDYPEEEAGYEEEEAADPEAELVEADQDFFDHVDFESPLHFVFFSGVGAWRTEIYVESDGSFTGTYEDMNSGESGTGYLSTTYLNEFEGRFSEITKLDAETFSMELAEMTYRYDVGEEWIEDEDKRIATEAYGFEKGKRFLLYSPHKDAQDLDEELLSWGAGHGKTPDDSYGPLAHWVLHNKETSYGFYSVPSVDAAAKGEDVVANTAGMIPANFEQMEFDNDYHGPGSEFIGMWQEVNYSTVEFAPNPWEIRYKDDKFIIKGQLPGDFAVILLTAQYKDGRLYSEDGTQIEYTKYQDPDTSEVNLPETIEAGDEPSQFYFAGGYLQWASELRGDMSDASVRGARIEGYAKK